MSTAKKFFEDNLSRTNPMTDPQSYNLYCGLTALAEQLDAIQRAQDQLARRLQQIERLVQSRLP